MIICLGIKFDFINGKAHDQYKICVLNIFFFNSAMDSSSVALYLLKLRVHLQIGKFKKICLVKNSLLIHMHKTQMTN